MINCSDKIAFNYQTILDMDCQALLIPLNIKPKYPDISIKSDTNNQLIEINVSVNSRISILYIISVNHSWRL